MLWFVLVLIVPLLILKYQMILVMKQKGLQEYWLLNDLSQYSRFYRIIRDEPHEPVRRKYEILLWGQMLIFLLMLAGIAAIWIIN